MQFRNDSQGRSGHDRSRGMVGERSRNHFMAEQRDKKHELEANREAIRRALNDGFEYETTLRERDAYAVRFINRKSGDVRQFRFLFESNYVRLSAFWWKRQ